MASNSSNRSKPQATLPEGLQAVPTVAADLVATTAVIYQITFSNGGTARTVTIADKNTSPLKLCDALPIAANTVYILQFQEGIKMIGGVNWVASGAGVNAEVFGFSNTH